MKSFNEFIDETYRNLFKSDKQDKEKYAEEVFTLLKKTYSKFGGLKGTGFNSPQDMIKNIPFWKLGFTGDKLSAVVMYKDKGTGRKLVAVASTPDKDGIKKLNDIFKTEFSRSFAEVSDPLLGWLGKYHRKIVDKYKMKSSEASKILKKEVNPIDDYFYSRDIGGELHTKLMLGTKEKNITK